MTKVNNTKDSGSPTALPQKTKIKAKQQNDLDSPWAKRKYPRRGSKTPSMLLSDCVGHSTTTFRISPMVVYTHDTSMVPMFGKDGSLHRTKAIVAAAQPLLAECSRQLESICLRTASKVDGSTDSTNGALPTTTVAIRPINPFQKTSFDQED